MKKLALVINSTGTGVVGFGSSVNSYSGGTTIESGILQITSNSTSAGTIGTAAVKLGNTIGSANTTLRLNTPGAVQNSLIVQAGNSGTSSLEFIHTTGVGAWDGAITLNKDLTLKVANGSSTVFRVATINGSISGTGNLIADQYNGGTFHTVVLAGANTYSGNTTVASGVLTLADTGSMTFYIGTNGSTNSVGGSGSANFSGS
ncbi:MAG: autotransporter-associated beta strand repeat-containing protein, partial [Rariglobus sp.]